MDTAQWPQDIGLVVSSSSASTNNNNSMVVGGMGRPQQQQQQQLAASERRTRPQKEQALNCPRCSSTNTKFCYYNNYSLTQPRYFCKACRRYWTEGGSIRNVPVGGGSRKNRRSSSSSTSSAAATPSSTTTASAATTSISLPTVASSSSKNQNPKFQEGQDLNLAFPLPEFGDHHHFPGIENTSSACTNTTTNTSGALSAMEMLRSTAGFQGRGLNPFMPMHPMPMLEYPSSGFGDFRSNSLSFPLDAGMNGSAGGGYGGGGLQEGSGRLLFPFEESTRPVSSGDGGGGGGDQSGGDTHGFWNGMMGGGGGGGGGGSW